MQQQVVNHIMEQAQMELLNMERVVLMRKVKDPLSFLVKNQAPHGVSIPQRKLKEVLLDIKVLQVHVLDQVVLESKD